MTTTTWLWGGLIIDGTGRSPFDADLAIRGDRIASIVPHQPTPPRSGDVVDCSGMVVIPGFIDIHTQSELSFLLDPLAPSKIIQGITTEVVGNCGFSPFPIKLGRHNVVKEFLYGLGMPAVDMSWHDFDGYVQSIASCRPVMNVAPLVGHGTLRIAAAGMDDTAITADVLDRMTTLLRGALEQGAFGLSTGLTYVPSRFASVLEIHALARIVEEYDALYATHARATAQPYATFDEAIAVGKATAARVQYSHIAINDPTWWGRAGDILRRFEMAAKAGVDIQYDIYPYDASASSLTQYLPAWTQERGEAGLRSLLSDGARFRRASHELQQGLFGRIPWDWDRVVVLLAGPGDEDLEGATIAAGATERGRSPEELCVELCARHGNLVQVALFYRSESDISEFLAHDLAIVGSDGNALPVTAQGHPHPRSFGSHARLIERFVRGNGALSLVDAVRKSTFAAAQRLGLEDRGRIAERTQADLAVLNPETVRETATWAHPTQLAQGACHVFVNGRRVVADGALTGARPGQVLRRS